MTTTSSDKPNLRHGSISSAPAPDVQQSPQQSRHVRSRLSIISLPRRDDTAQPVQRAPRKSRTSFSASSFSHRTSTPDLRAYSHPLSPQEIHDLAVTSLDSPRPQLRDVAASTGTVSSERANAPPKPKFMTLSNGLYLPFVDRQSEVASLLQHPANVSTLTLIELVFSDEKQISNFRSLLFDVPREEVDDVKWISTIRAILKPRSEILWAKLKTILGVPPDLDDDDYQLNAYFFGRSLSNIPENITRQLGPSDQSTAIAHTLTAPPSKKGTRSPSTTSPIIEEVESTDSNVSEQDQEVEFDSIHALCFETAPAFIPRTDSATSENAPEPSSMGTIGGSNVKQPHRIRDQGHDLEPSQIRDVSSPSSGSTGSNTSFSRGIRFASLRRPSSQRDRHDMLRPTINGIPQRGRSPLSQSVTNFAEEVEEGRDKKSEGGHESDVSGASSVSLDREKKGSVEEGSQIMTGTGDVTRPRKPSLRSDKTSDIPSRDIPPSAPPSDAISQKGETKRIEESPKSSASKAPAHRTRRPSTSSRTQSPSLSTISLSENAFADHPTTSSPVLKGRPRFPASFSKSPVARKPRAVTVWHSRQPTDAGPAKQRRSTGHPRSHTVSSSVPTQPQQTNARLSPKPPPPSPATPGTSPSGAKVEHVRPRRAMSMIQRRPLLSRRSSQSSSKTDEEKEDGEKSKSSVEVEGLKDGVRGTKNPLYGV